MTDVPNGADSVTAAVPPPVADAPGSPPPISPPPTLPPPTTSPPTLEFITNPSRWRLYPTTPPAPPLTSLWQGYLAGGNVTMLTSQWKTGKTTLLALLLQRMRTGGMLAGLPVARGNALVLSEEAASFWDERNERLQLRDHVSLLCQPFNEVLTVERWIALLDWIVAFHAAHGLSLVVIDSVASFLPVGVEQNAARAFQCLRELRRLTQHGLAVALAHHPRKGVTLPGQASRGTGALPACVDILIEMYGLPSAPAGDRRRRLLAFSRHAQTPHDLLLEWTADGLDYDVRGPVEDDEFLHGWELLRTVFEEAKTKLTRPQILDDWPLDLAKPAGQTLWRWLNAAGDRGLVQRDGRGRKGEPFRYWLPGKIEEWLADPMLFMNNYELYEETWMAQQKAEPEEDVQEKEKRLAEEKAGKEAIMREVMSELSRAGDSGVREGARSA
jgi:hypothetical protein